MDQWAIYIDIEGFSSTYTIGTQPLISLGALMEAILDIGSKCYPETPYRLFAHQVGDGFVISGEFGWPDLKQPTTVAIALLRAVLHAGGVAKAAISEGQLADVLGCYPERIQQLYARSHGGAFSLGGGLMTVLPVMGTALINSVKLLHSSQTPSGSLLILPKSQAGRLPAGVTFVEVGELCVLDWLHASYLELDELIKTAQLPPFSEAGMISALNRYIKTNQLFKDWVDNTRLYLNMKAKKNFFRHVLSFFGKVFGQIGGPK
jgi:hypothetical protein